MKLRTPLDFLRVYDVACSDGGAPDAVSHRCPDNGARVDISDCSVTSRLGDPQLKTVWTDPDFDPSPRAFYYVRALENPTCRWSTWDAVLAGVAPRPNLDPTVQERVWSSPICMEDGGKLDWRLAQDGMTLELPAGGTEIKVSEP